MFEETTHYDLIDRYNNIRSSSDSETLYKSTMVFIISALNVNKDATVKSKMFNINELQHIVAVASVISSNCNRVNNASVTLEYLKTNPVMINTISNIKLSNSKLISNINAFNREYGRLMRIPNTQANKDKINGIVNDIRGLYNNISSEHIISNVTNKLPILIDDRNNITIDMLNENIKYIMDYINSISLNISDFNIKYTLTRLILEGINSLHISEVESTLRDLIYVNENNNNEVISEIIKNEIIYCISRDAARDDVKNKSNHNSNSTPKVYINNKSKPSLEFVDKHINEIMDDEFFDKLK